jgi:hypothetical protein
MTHTSGKGGPCPPHLVSLRSRVCYHILRNPPIRLVVAPCPSGIMIDESSPQLADKWHELIEASTSGESSVTDIPSWLSKATLDACAISPEIPVLYSRAYGQGWNGCFRI